MNDRHFPNFVACILCEGVREEIGGKSIIFGFFGVSPHVRLEGEIEKNIRALAFLLYGSGGNGEFIITADIADSENKRIIALKEQVNLKIDIPAGRVSTQMVFVFQNLKFPAYGDYKLRLYADGDLINEWPFVVGERAAC